MIEERRRRNKSYNNNEAFDLGPCDIVPPRRDLGGSTPYPFLYSANSAPLRYWNKLKSFPPFCKGTTGVLNAPPKITLPPLSFPCCPPLDCQMNQFSRRQEAAGAFGDCRHFPSNPEGPKLPKIPSLDMFKSPWKILSLCLVCIGVACICIPCLFCLKSIFFSCN